MSPLFDTEDWPPVGGPDVPLPSFLRDDPVEPAGPSDVSLTFRSEGPAFADVAVTTWSSTTWSSQPAHSTSRSSGFGYAVPAADPPGYGAPAPADDGGAPTTAGDGGAPTTAGDPAGYAAPAAAHSEPACHPEPSASLAPERAGESSASAGWDPLFDPWPPVDPPEFGRSGSGRSWSAQWPLPTQPGRDELSPEHPSGPLPRTPADITADAASAYDVTLTGALGFADLGFRKGHWFALEGSAPRAVSIRDALRAHPELAGPVVQVVCWWMRENPREQRALDVATELAFAVGEAARAASGTAR